MINKEMANNITTIDLLRHGECIDGHCYRGSTDVQLTPAGLSAMKRKIDSFILQKNGDKKSDEENSKEKPWHRIVSSPLQRCAYFSQALSQTMNCPLHIEPALKEIHFGDWEGKSVGAVWQSQAEKVEQWANDPVNYPPPNGEALNDFFTRVSTRFLSLIQHYSGERLLIVTHGGVIRALLTHCLSMPLKNIHCFDIPYACMSQLQVSQSTNGEYFYHLVAHNK